MSVESIEVALFPIPNVVAFPGTVVPLHVFEPRYRDMVHACVEEERLLAVCHTKKTIRAARQNQTPQEALKSNQATYEPQDVFSAGACEIVETTPDGRLYANVHMSMRLKYESELQTLPYRIVSCSELKDMKDDHASAEARVVQIKQTIVDIAAGQTPNIEHILNHEPWSSLTADEFCYQIFQFLRFSPETMQDILEDTSLLSRLDRIAAVLTEIAAQRP